MNLYSRQLQRIHNKIKNGIVFSIIILSKGDLLKDKRTLHGLYQQVYTDYEVAICNIDDYFIKNEEHLENGKWEREVYSNFESFDVKRLQELLKKTTGDYILFIEAGNVLPEIALNEYSIIVDEKHTDIIYADEAICNFDKQEILDFVIKPDYSDVDFFKHLISGQAVIFKKEVVFGILKKVYCDNPNMFIRELSFNARYITDSFYHIPLVLLLRNKETNYIGEECLLFELNKRLIKENKNFFYKKSTTVNMTWEICTTDNLLRETAIILVEEDLLRTRQIYSQLALMLPECIIFLIVKSKDENELSDFSKEIFADSRSIIKTSDKSSYRQKIEEYLGNTGKKYEVIIRDIVQWINRDGFIKMLNCLINPDVCAVSPRISSSSDEGDIPQILYAGGEIVDCIINSQIFDGRNECLWGEQDLAWTNRKMGMISQNIFVIKSNIWKDILPLNDVIQSAFQFATEISFILLKLKKTCEYSAQTGVWVYDKYKRIHELENTREYKEFYDINLTYTKCYQYWIYKYYYYIIAGAKKAESFLLGYRTHLKEGFKLYPAKDSNYDKCKKDILVYSHELSLTGAPVVLQDVVISLTEKYNFIVISPMDGELKEKYVENGITVIIDPQVEERNTLLLLSEEFDVIWVNTIVPYRSIRLLGETDKKVIWWIHDSELGYVTWLQFELPETVADNIRILCVSEYAQRVLKKYRPLYQSEILHYGLEDIITQKNERKLEFNIPKDKVSFVNIGQIISRKGQDVLAKAIIKLQRGVLEKCYFIFVGKIVEAKIFSYIEDLLKRYPDNIFYIEKVPHEDIIELYNQTDVVVCSSKDDPLPTFIAEGMMCSKICICSQNTGFYTILQNGINGFTYRNDDENELADVIMEVLNRKDDWGKIEENARKTYEKKFSLEIVKKHMIKLNGE